MLEGKQLYYYYGVEIYVLIGTIFIIYRVISFFIRI